MKRFIGRFTEDLRMDIASIVFGIVGAIIFGMFYDDMNLLLQVVSYITIFLLLANLVAAVGLDATDRYISYLSHNQIEWSLSDTYRLDGVNTIMSFLMYNKVILILFGAGAVLGAIPFSVIMGIGLLYAFSRLVRFAFGIKARLISHVSDLNAHKTKD